MSQRACAGGRRVPAIHVGAGKVTERMDLLPCPGGQEGAFALLFCRFCLGQCFHPAGRVDGPCRAASV